jgi:hypothetical protein
VSQAVHVSRVAGLDASDDGRLDRIHGVSWSGHRGLLSAGEHGQAGSNEEARVTHIEREDSGVPIQQDVIVN